ncbi:MAG: hypothetical protein V7L26_13135 [Nostoc sp.]
MAGGTRLPDSILFREWGIETLRSPVLFNLKSDRSVIQDYNQNTCLSIKSDRLFFTAHCQTWVFPP